MTNSLSTYADMDCAWIASDNAGNLAVFITAGKGPIPQSAIDNGNLDPTDVESTLLSLAVCSNIALESGAGEIGSFIELGKRGFFVFDWPDIHRSHRNEAASYEIVVAPDRPVNIDALPAIVASAAASTRFVDLAFSNTVAIHASRVLSIDG